MWIFYQNANGICTKLNEFNTKIIKENYDLILITETKLNEKYRGNIPGYKTIRRDRETSGGGVLIAVRRDRTYLKRKWQTDEVEDLWITLTYRNYSIHICCVYLVPQCNASDFNAFILNAEKRMKENPNDYFMIVGDFNIPNFSTSAPSNRGGKLRLLQDFIDEYELKQYNRGKNFNGRSLDLVFCNKKISCRKARGLVQEVELVATSMQIFY